MSSIPVNILQNVQTYQKAELAWLLNSFWAISETNKKFKEFENLTANLGDTVTFDTTPRYLAMAGLVISEQPSVQRIQSLTCGQAYNIAAAFTDQQFVFNVREYMNRWGMAAMKELGTKVEADILKNLISGVITNDPQNANYGVPQIHSGPFRFFGNGINPINSFTQLAQAVANFEDFGAASHKMMGIIPVVDVPPIIGTGLNQFVPTRNDEIARNWLLGKFGGLDVEWSSSNLLPIQVAGTIGNSALTLTVVSTNDPTGTNVTQINFTVSGDNSDANAIQAGDLLEFNDGVSGHPNLRFLTFIGHVPTQQPVQFRATAQAGTDSGGNISVSIETINGIGLVWNPLSANQNISNTTPIVAGMQCSVLPTHRAGGLLSGDQFYLAMPRLPTEDPFPTVTLTDEDSGASIRHYWGSQFGLNNRAYVRDTIWGSTMVAENVMRMIFPA